MTSSTLRAMVGKRTARCAFCDETFSVEHRSGPTPSYCSQAHRQRAYEARRRTARTDEAIDLGEQLRELQSRVRWLERDNRELRRERDDALNELTRLRPLPDNVQRLVDTRQPPRPTPTDSLDPSRRRWKPSR